MNMSLFKAPLFNTFLEAETIPTLNIYQSRLYMNAWGFKALGHFFPPIVSVSIRIWIWGVPGLAWNSNWESQDFSGKQEEESVAAKEHQSGIVCFFNTSSLVWMYPSFSKQEL